MIRRRRACFAHRGVRPVRVARVTQRAASPASRPRPSHLAPTHTRPASRLPRKHVVGPTDVCTRWRAIGVGGLAAICATGIREARVALARRPIRHSRIAYRSTVLCRARRPVLHTDSRERIGVVHVAHVVRRLIAVGVRSRVPIMRTGRLARSGPRLVTGTVRVAGPPNAVDRLHLGRYIAGRQDSSTRRHAQEDRAQRQKQRDQSESSSHTPPNNATMIQIPIAVPLPLFQRSRERSKKRGPKPPGTHARLTARDAPT